MKQETEANHNDKKHCDCDPKCEEITIEPCEQCVVKKLNIDISSGLLLKVKVTVKKLCVGKDVAIGVMICEEKNDHGHDHDDGNCKEEEKFIATQVCQIKVEPSACNCKPCSCHCKPCCDVTKEFIFAIPTECGTEVREFKAFAVANYILHKSKCCCKE